MARSTMLLLGALAVLGACLLPACPKREAKLFERLYASDFGLGVKLDGPAAQGSSVLGTPNAVQKIQDATNVTEYYLPPDTTTTDSDTPQLALTYIDDKLVLLYNRYFPEDSAKPQSPWFIEPLPGVKLGNRQHDFVDALGAANDPARENGWVFTAKDGRTIRIAADFVDVPSAGDQLCCMLQVALVPQVAEAIGEEAAKAADWRKKVGL